MKKRSMVLLGIATWVALGQGPGIARAAQQAAASTQSVRPIGVVSEVQPNQLTLQTDAGPVLTVHLPATVSVMRVPPGAKSLQDGAKISVSEINAGDRVLILGPVSADQKSVVASRVIVMSKSALEQTREAEQVEWQRGISGVVKSIDPAAKAIVLAVPNTPPTPSDPTHPVTITLGPGATLLRYAPDSVKFSDAKPGTFDEIKVGDQVRVAGTKSADGTHFSAEKLVSGTFRNIGATVVSVDASQGTITVKDLATGKPLLVRTNADSKLHQLPPFLAMVIARFNSGGAAGASAPGEGGAGERSGTMVRGESYRGSGGPAAGGGMARGGTGGAGGMRGGGPPRDFNQMLDRTPALSLGELTPGEPLIVVSTEGAKPSEVTAIAVLAGVEPILEARPKGSQEVRLGPWNMSVGGGGGEGGGAGGEQGP